MAQSINSSTYVHDHNQWLYNLYFIMKFWQINNNNNSFIGENSHYTELIINHTKYINFLHYIIFRLIFVDLIYIYI